MIKLLTTAAVLASVLPAQSVPAETARLVTSRMTIARPNVMLRVPQPKTKASDMNRPGPVVSPDPYFTLKLGENEVYLDAKDHSLAYYKPAITLGVRSGTPMAEGVGSLAAELQGFLFRYYRFESGGNPKWASMQAVVTVERPVEVTLEAVQSNWKKVTRLLPLPYKLDAASGVRMILPYPARTVTFTQLDAQGGDADSRWYLFSTNTRPDPPDLLTEEDNDVLNETKAKDFASLITSDLSDMPSFQPTLEVKATYPGWTGTSPLFNNIIRFRTVGAMRPLAPVTTKPSRPARNVRPKVVPMRFAEGTVRPSTVTKVGAPLTPAVKAVGPRVFARRPDLIRVVGTLQPRNDIDYSYSGTKELTVSIPITCSKSSMANYDYYFMSDSGRYGGPYFEASSAPDRPQVAQSPEGFQGYWYESHFLGKRLVWPAPRGLRLRWDVESGLRPSCRFSMTNSTDGKLTANISYDLYPDFSIKQLTAATESIEQMTGEKIDLLPFTDVVDANQMVLTSGNATVNSLVAAKQLTITRLSPKQIDDAWFRVDVHMPVDDWAALTMFMKLGELGSWDFGIKTGASSGMAEKASFSLNGNLLDTMGGPVTAAKRGFDDSTGGYEVALDNYWLEPLQIQGLRFNLSGAEKTTADIWFSGDGVTLPAVGSVSSFDQSEGSTPGTSISVKETESSLLRTLMASGKYDSVSVGLTSDMIGRPADPSGRLDQDIAFSFIRSLCYQYIGSSELIKVPVSPAELSQWADYRSGRIVVRYQGFVYTRDLDLSSTNTIEMRRLPKEGAYALAGKPGDAESLEYRAIFTRNDGTVVYLPGQSGSDADWSTGDITSINLDMTKALP